MRTVEERFWEKVGPHDDPNVCWLWLGAVTGKNKPSDRGYGQLRVDGKSVLTHRFSYALCFGPIPKGMTIDHVKARGCTNTLCVNPYHLEVVTLKVNILRGISPSALHAKVTHCPQGHPYNEENTYYGKTRRHRHCKICHHVAMYKMRYGT